MTTLDANQIEIQTGDGIRFSLPLAGPVTRFLALAVDWAVVTAGVWGLGQLLGFVPALSQDVKGAVLAVSWFVLSIGYPMALEWLWGGRTLGKRVVGLRVADATGLRLTFSQIVIRNLLRSADSLPIFYLVGGLAMISGKRMQRLGDLAAGTIVLRTREVPLPEMLRRTGTRINSLRPYRTLAARLRQKVDPETARIALEALRRRGDLDAESRLRVFAEMATGFRELVEFPEDATLHLTDEQYVWNVVEILYEAKK